MKLITRIIIGLLLLSSTGCIIPDFIWIPTTFISVVDTAQQFADEEEEGKK